MLAAELAVLCAVFFLMCFLGTGSDEKNIRSYSTYPDEVQELVRKDPALASKIKITSPLVILLSNVALFAVILFFCGLPIRQKSFPANFITMTILGQGLNLFDLLVIDNLWWRNSPRVRFSVAKDSPELYRPMKKHVEAFLRGVLAFLAVAVVDGLLLCFV